MRCPYCNEEYDDNMEYCPNCGGDNPNVDQREIREAEQGKMQKTFATPIAPSFNVSYSSSENTIEFQNDDGNYIAHFDMNDQFEAASYIELKDLESKKSRNGLTSLIVGILGGILLFVGVFTSSMALSIIGFIFTALIFIGTIVVIVKASANYQKYSVLYSQAQLEYFAYKKEQEGAEVLSKELDKRIIVYKQNGVIKTVKFHYYEMGSRYQRGGWR